ncbi:U4/U6-U5 snRNP complex subunit PRP4 [Ascoidea rubescens DSM 1968]|uniref:WD40 repeat-like protein n=1 Tax=Ascoidea rubescens DSM 1968 TaxID=1344418 RepID=A0A1D2VKN5_9ASCO|nr:WD40 repeat-like protein [Ascoidea rubescens DSM 1968]ODV62174.1 WD40 repeat-like protein [Ascoidea rubescens DSM 1968]
MYESDDENEINSDPKFNNDDIENEDEDEDEEFFTPGSEEITKARLYLVNYSLLKAKRRIAFQNQLLQIPLKDQLKYRRGVNDRLSRFELIGSNILSNRAISSVKFSPLGDKIAMGSWAGELKVLDSNLISSINYDCIGSPDDKLSGIDWHPFSGISQNDREISLATGNSSDNLIHLWSLESTKPISTLKGHDSRVIKTIFHPSGKFLASSSFDQTWRIWDLNKNKEVYLQEGHSKEVYSISFQCDGALMFSGGLDAIGRVWDLRIGKSIMVLNDHIKGIFASDWSDNGYQIATGGADCSIKIWDLRYNLKLDNQKNENNNTKPLFTIPAHNKLVSDIKFFKENANKINSILNEFKPEMNSSSSTFLISSSYDGSLKIWSADSWIKVKTLKGHIDNKIMSCDINTSGDKIISSGWDRSVRLWSNVSEDLI